MKIRVSIIDDNTKEFDGVDINSTLSKHDIETVDQMLELMYHMFHSAGFDYIDRVLATTRNNKKFEY